MIKNCYILNIPWHWNYLFISPKKTSWKIPQVIQIPVSNGISSSNSFTTQQCIWGVFSGMRVGLLKQKNFRYCIWHTMHGASLYTMLWKYAKFLLNIKFLKKQLRGISYDSYSTQYKFYWDWQLSSKAIVILFI